MVWIYDKKKGKHCNLRMHHTRSGKRYVMHRKHGGGTRRKYL